MSVEGMSLDDLLAAVRADMTYETPAAWAEIRRRFVALSEQVEKLTEERDAAVDRANGGSHEDWLYESELRVAAEAERDEAYEDSRRSLDRLNRLLADKTGGIDPHTADDYLAHRLHVESEGRKAAEVENARLVTALEPFSRLDLVALPVTYSGTDRGRFIPTGEVKRLIDCVHIARAALAGKEGGK